MVDSRHRQRPNNAGYCFLVEPEAPEVIVYRRTESGFSREEWNGLGAIIPLPELGIELPLDDVYRRVAFEPDAGADTE